jgi:predicted transcriptional regulator
MPNKSSDILLSIRPVFASRILNGAKTIELRRKFPESSAAGTVAVIYSSSPVSAVVGYAEIDDILRMPVRQIWKEHGINACVTKVEFDAYFSGLKYGFAILLKNVRALAKQLNAFDLKREFGIVPPQSYRYIENGYVSLLKDERLQIPDRHKCSDRTRGREARSSVSR